MNVSVEYTDYIDSELKKYFQKGKLRFSYEEVARLSGLSRARTGKIFSDRRATADTQAALTKAFGILPYGEWTRRHTLAGKMSANLVQHHWLSYRFNSKRQLYISSWMFKQKGTDLIASKIAPKGFTFKGTFQVDNELGLSGTLSNNTLEMKYQSYLPVIRDMEQDKIADFDCFVFSVLFKHGEEIYSTIEVLYKQKDGKSPAHYEKLVREKTNAMLPFMPDKQFNPTNQEYLAYNFLTRFNPKIRIPVSFPDKQAITLLHYQHNIRVGCPVHSIKTQKEFDRVYPVAAEVHELLQTDYGFKKQNIYLELLNFSSLEGLHDPAPYLFEKNKTINYTHFLAIIPRLKQQSMGIFAEIFYRVGRAYPVILLYEDEESLLYVLKNILNNQHITNMRCFQCKFEDIPRLLRSQKEHLLSFTLR